MIKIIFWTAVLLLTAGSFLITSVIFAKGVLKKIRFFLIGALFAILGGILFVTVMCIKGLDAFSNEMLIAQATCKWTGKNEFDLIITQFSKRSPPKTELFHLSGDQWLVGGEIIKWHPWLTSLGIPSYYKLTRLSGRYSDIRQEDESPSSSFILNGGEDPAWSIFFRLDPYLPFVDAVYGSAAFVSVEPDKTFGIYANYSGYLIKKLR